MSVNLYVIISCQFLTIEAQLEMHDINIYDSNQASPSFLLLTDDPDPGENCAHKHVYKSVWYSHFCSARHPFMCYNERLILVKENKTWEDALVHCRALEAVDPNLPADSYQNHRYDLATILTPDDLNFARETAQEATSNEVW